MEFSRDTQFLWRPLQQSDSIAPWASVSRAPQTTDAVIHDTNCYGFMDYNEHIVIQVLKNIIVKIHFSVVQVIVVTHGSAGRLRVTLPRVFSPYLRYPKNPTKAYRLTTTVMAMLSTPGQPRKCSGCFMEFSIGSTCHTRTPLKTWISAE